MQWLPLRIELRGALGLVADLQNKLGTEDLSTPGQQCAEQSSKGETRTGRSRCPLWLLFLEAVPSTSGEGRNTVLPAQSLAEGGRW